MAINLYSKASVDSLLTAKLSISSLTNAAATTLNATAPTTNQVLSFDGTQLKWATPAGGATWGSITGTLSSQSDLNTALNARVSTAGDTMDNNAILEFNDTYTNGSLGLTGNAVTLTSSTAPGESGVLNYNQLILTDSIGAMQVNPTGLVFPDSSVQSTAYTGGGTFVGDRLSIYAGYLYNEQTAANVTALTLAGTSTVQAKNLTLQSGSGGVLTFSDGTTQSTQPHDIPAGGATGTILNKINSADYNVQWSSASTLGLATLASPSLTGTPLAPTATVGTNTTQIATTAFVLANAGSGGGGVDVQTFGSSSTSGTFTWTKPAGAKVVDIYLMGPGGGGGSGTRQATSSARSGGGGGSAGGLFYFRVGADSLNSTESVVVGAGGAGGTVRTTDNSLGANGSAGANTSFSAYKAPSGDFGLGGSTAIVNGGVARNNLFFNLLQSSGGGATGNVSTGSAATMSTALFMHACGGGGGGGQAATVTTNVNGGNGASAGTSSTTPGLNTAIAGGTAGNGTTGVQATAGTSMTNQYIRGGTGGGGGFYRTGQAGGTGGAGGWPGGGAGGGGASDNGFASGAGGAGANGFALIITYF